MIPTSISFYRRPFSTKATFNGFVVSWVKGHNTWARDWLICDTRDAAERERANHDGFFATVTEVRYGQHLPAFMLND